MVLLKKSKIYAVLFSIFMIILIIMFPDISNRGISQGLVIAANVIIPSLFPFLVCVLMLIKSRIRVHSDFLNKVLYKLFGHNFDMFLVFVLSMLGGYPVGAKLINELYNQEIINDKTANLMLSYCVNAGPALVVSIVGNAFNSKAIGMLLLAAHLLSSLVIAFFNAKEIKKQHINYTHKENILNSFSDIIVESVTDASESIIGICSYVILFSSINSYIDFFFSNVKIVKYIALLTEVTSAVIKCKNVYLSSFLLGLSGISIWCQLFSITKKIKINKLRFIISRLIHGIISLIFTKILISVFKIKLSTYSNNINFAGKLLYTNTFIFSSIMTMLIILFMFLYFKKNSGKIIDDVI